MAIEKGDRTLAKLIASPREAEEVASGHVRGNTIGSFTVPSNEAMKEGLGLEGYST